MNVLVGCIPQCFWRIPLFSPWIFYVSSHAVVTKASGRILTIEMDWFNGTPTGNGCFLSLNQSAPTGNMCLIFNGFQWICLCFSIAIFNNKKNWDEHMKSSAAAGENCTSCSYLDLPIGGPWPRISCDEIGPLRDLPGCTLAATWLRHATNVTPLAGSTWDDFRWKNHKLPRWFWWTGTGTEKWPSRILMAYWYIVILPNWHKLDWDSWFAEFWDGNSKPVW